jgi:hypothetical protein
MPQISGLHHIAVPRKDALLSGEWFERVFGFTRILVEEEEDRVTGVVLEHPCGILLFLHQTADAFPAYPDLATFALGVADRDELLMWADHLSALGVPCSAPRPAHLGWALDVTDPEGFRIQLHTREILSADDS